jgi:Domain of Unknown Function (DUF928)
MSRISPSTVIAALLALTAVSGIAPPMAVARADADSAAATPVAPPALYHPPLRGAPGGRVGGASRGMVRVTGVLPTIDVVAPADHTGDTEEAAPTLYYFVSAPVKWPTEFTIAQPLRPQPVIEVTIPSPTAPGLYAVRLADHGVRLEPGIVYTWSISAVIDPRAWSRNIVASATILRTGDASAVAAVHQAASSPPMARAAILGQAGLWYDAVAAAAAAENGDGHAALDSLLHQVGLNGPARFDHAAEMSRGESPRR